MPNLQFGNDIRHPQTRGCQLEDDLSNPKSLVRHVMFDPDIRKRVTEKLDGVSGEFFTSVRTANFGILDLPAVRQFCKIVLQSEKKCGPLFG